MAAVLFSFVLMFAGQAFAQESPAEWDKQVFMNQLATAKVMKFSGTVVSHDVACHCIVVSTPGARLPFRTTMPSSCRNTTRRKVSRLGPT